MIPNISRFRGVRRPVRMETREQAGQVGRRLKVENGCDFNSQYLYVIASKYDAIAIILPSPPIKIYISESRRFTVNLRLRTRAFRRPNNSLGVPHFLCFVEGLGKIPLESVGRWENVRTRLIHRRYPQSWSIPA